jgi:hypothetical protein
MIWACLDAFVNEGRSKVAVCVDAMVAPFGRRTSNGVFVSTLLLQWALAINKFEVQPYYKMAVECD